MPDRLAFNAVAADQVQVRLAWPEVELVREWLMEPDSDPSLLLDPERGLPEALSPPSTEPLPSDNYFSPPATTTSPHR